MAFKNSSNLAMCIDKMNYLQSSWRCLPSISKVFFNINFRPRHKALRYTFLNIAKAGSSALRCLSLQTVLHKLQNYLRENFASPKLAPIVLARFGSARQQLILIEPQVHPPSFSIFAARQAAAVVNLVRNFPPWHFALLALCRPGTETIKICLDWTISMALLYSFQHCFFSFGLCCTQRLCAWRHARRQDF